MARRANNKPNTQKSAGKPGVKSGKTAPRKTPVSKTAFLAIAVIVVLAVVLVGYFTLSKSSGSSSSGTPGQEVTMPDGLKYVDETVGTGPSPTRGHTVTVNYVGTLENGLKFDSSYDRSQPYSFPIGMNRVIKGWDEGLMTMKVGGKRKLIIPPALGYGASGMGAKIPPNSTLVFEVELLGVE